MDQQLQHTFAGRTATLGRGLHQRHARVQEHHRESVSLLLESMPEQALSAAHEAWHLAGGRLREETQALVLTQIAACHRSRGDLRGALRAVRRAEALLVAKCGESPAQVLAVRAQLVSLLRAAGRDDASARRRLVRTYSILGKRVHDLAAAGRYRQLREVFLELDCPPTWAETLHLRWRNVYR